MLFKGALAPKQVDGQVGNNGGEQYRCNAGQLPGGGFYCDLVACCALFADAARDARNIERKVLSAALISVDKNDPAGEFT